MPINLYGSNMGAGDDDETIGDPDTLGDGDPKSFFEDNDGKPFAGESAVAWVILVALLILARVLWELADED